MREGKREAAACALCMHIMTHKCDNRKYLLINSHWSIADRHLWKNTE